MGIVIVVSLFISPVVLVVQIVLLIKQNIIDHLSLSVW